MVERARGKTQPPITGGGGVPPVRQGELRAGIDHTVQRRKRDLGADRASSITATGADNLVRDLREAKPPEHLPHCGDIAEGEMT